MRQGFKSVINGLDALFNAFKVLIKIHEGLVDDAGRIGCITRGLRLVTQLLDFWRARYEETLGETAELRGHTENARLDVRYGVRELGHVG